MIDIDIRADLSGVSARLGVMERELMPAAVRAMNKTLTTVRAEAAREFRPMYAGLKVSAIKARMKLVRATRTKPVAAVVFNGSRFSLYRNFGMRAFGAWGVRFGKLPWRVETLSGDIATEELKANPRRLFRNRLRRGGRAAVFLRWTEQRLSHEMLVAPGLAQALVETAIGNKMVTVGRARFLQVFDQEARFILSKRK